MLAQSGHEQLSTISLGRGKQPLALAGHDLHHALRDGAFKNLHQRADLARAAALDIGPARLRERLDLMSTS